MYLGIVGYKGEDKTKISRLYGATLSWIMNNREQVDKDDPTDLPWDYYVNYMKWVDILCNHTEGFPELDRVYFASFSHPLKTIVSLITGVPFTLLNQSSTKNKYILNINTFEYKERDNERVLSPDELFNERNKELSTEYKTQTETPDSWMTLNDYVIYFGYYICRNYIGKDIWVNSERVSNERYPIGKETLRIYTDIRTRSEYNYIKENEGCILRIQHRGRKPKESIVYDESLYNNELEVDVELHMQDDLRKLCDTIYRDSLKIATKLSII